uniref:Uncharacterized protein n=1 Tax=Lepeophtheirus salmonis TaxID=72036 RepID=A0A0K2UXT1_LEPSM
MFSDENTFNVDPVFNRQNDRVVIFGDVAEEYRYVSTNRQTPYLIDDVRPGYIERDGHKSCVVPFRIQAVG